MAPKISPETAAAGVADSFAPLSAAALAAVVAGMAGGWLAAGAAGMIDLPLQRALFWVALAVAMLAAWPGRMLAARDCLLTAVALIGAVLLTFAAGGLLDVAAVALVLAALAGWQRGPAGRAMSLVALAVGALAVFRFACAWIPAVWLWADAAGRQLGLLGGRIAGSPLRVGASFGGVDYLLSMGALAAGWLAFAPRPRLVRAILVVAAILAGHLAYLVMLAHVPDLVAALPAVVEPTVTDMSRLGTWAWGNALRSLLPWNVPLLALLIHGGIAAAMFRGAGWLPPLAKTAAAPGGQSPPAGKHRLARGPAPSELQALRAWAGDGWLLVCAAVSAALLPGFTMLMTGYQGLNGRTVAIHDGGGRPASSGARSFGLLPRLVESLGGRTVQLAGLSAAELQGADVLVLLPPGEGRGPTKLPGTPGEQGYFSPAQLDAVGSFVRGGGSLLVAARPESHLGAAENVMNAVLRPLAISVRDDAALPAVKNWEGICRAASPPLAGGAAGPDGFGLDQPASLRVGWPARPLLVGRWGWSEPGGDAAHLPGAAYAAGDPLGDLVLAADQRAGRGRVAVLADAAPLSDERLPASYPFAAKLLAALAAKHGSPQDAWRQVLGLLAAAGLVVALAWRSCPPRLALATLVLGIAAAFASLVNEECTSLVPNGRHGEDNSLAYIDASHLDFFSGDPRQENGLGQFCRVLEQNGYLPLLLPAVDKAHLERAGLLVSIAPGREFSSGERQAVKEFVERGGVFISMVGAEEAGPSRELLRQFGLRVPPMPVPPAENIRETEPLGCFPRSIDEHGQQKTTVQFYAAWPVEGAGADPLVWWSDAGRELPVVVSLAVAGEQGSGTVVLIGDTCFALNKNLAADARGENADFWCWLLARAARHKEWSPPKAAPNEPAEGGVLEK